ncbi:MAG TPA: hypothetical protein VFH78_06540, partial [Candidatus Thermoplasmatota archaeon]|nr:hypothetical protein [Candidatus Thermoplasmatota archaeon]
MGSFTTARSDADMDAVCRAAGRTPPCAFLESYPEQFIFSFDTRRACEQARERIARVETARPGECEPPAPAPEAWVLRGAFTM